MANPIKSRIVTVLTAFIGVIATSPGWTQDVVPQMTAERLGEIILKVDEDAVQDANSWYFHLEGLETAVVYDAAADRMRIMIPIGPAEELVSADLERMMQAEFRFRSTGDAAISHRTGSSRHFRSCLICFDQDLALRSAFAYHSYSSRNRLIRLS